jgi:hypothetical protein
MRRSRLLSLTTILLSGAAGACASSPAAFTDIDGAAPDVTTGGGPDSSADASGALDAGTVDSSIHPTDGGQQPDGAATDSASTDGGSEAGADDSGPGFDASSVDAAWTGRPPAVPLIVRNPYLSTWSAADQTAGNWPSFWDGSTKAMTGIARIDSASFVFLGAPAGLTTTPGNMTLVSRTMTPTKSEFVYTAGGITLTLDFLSPVEPADLKRQSAPVGYVTATAVSSDGNPHTVSLYFDISGEWAHGDSTQKINWARESVPRPGGGNLTVQSFTPATPQPLVEVNQYPAWGTAFVAADTSSALTVEIGQDTVVRSLAASAGALDGTIDSNMPRAINTQWPVLGFAFGLGSITGTPSTPVTLLIGHARDPAVSYLGSSVPPLWKSYWPTWEAMVADERDDATAAAARAYVLDARIVSDARAAGGDEYAALCTLGFRQAFGGTELVGTTTNPWLMLKEISSDGNVSTVDVVYPASPAFLYANPYLLKLMLDPLLQYAETGGWPKMFAEHDLGSSYPNAAGHNDGNEEDMPIEETANMLLMMAAYVQKAKPADAQTYAMAHYKIAKQWADYLVPNTLDPVNQNQTDDFTGFINHSVNLALKGIIGVGAFSVLAGAAGNAGDQASYLSQAQTLIGKWATLAQDDAGGAHLLLEYDKPGTWSLKYNAFYDRVLGLNLVPASILAEEAAWYASQAQAFGVELDPRNTYSKTDWEIWTAAAIDDTTVRQTLIKGVYGYATTSTARVPYGDLYYVANGQWDSFQARPVQGGMFTLLARNGVPLVSP